MIFFNRIYCVLGGGNRGIGVKFAKSETSFQDYKAEPEVIIILQLDTGKPCSLILIHGN